MSALDEGSSHKCATAVATLCLSVDEGYRQHNLSLLREESATRERGWASHSRALWLQLK